MKVARPGISNYECWAGVDVGGRRKGFHVAVVDGDRLLAGPVRLKEPKEVVEFLREWKPRRVAVDSPRSPAPDGQLSREGERCLAREVCGIRYTPDRRRLEANRTYYGWILQGLELYATLTSAQFRVIECFPTASWTRWAGPRGKAPRSRWSQGALARLGLANMPARVGQDGRDAIGAAMTAYADEKNCVDRFGDIVVPKAGTPAEKVS